MTRWVLWLAAGVIAVGASWVFLRGRSAPGVRFAAARTETLVSTVVTNGKAEPVEWAVVRADRAGRVDTIGVAKGQRIVRGQALIVLDTSEAKAELAAVDARLQQARAELLALEQGVRASELRAMDAAIEKARFELRAAESEQDALDRLQRRGAATARMVAAAQEQVQRLRLELAAAEKRRAAMLPETDRAVTLARIREAEAQVAAARLRIEAATVRAPSDGVLYQFDLRPGSFLNPGDPVGCVGRLDRLRVKVYVDEPELGRVAAGMPVQISWDALPGRTWSGVVSQTPTEVVALGSRQVGEVICEIGNEDGTLLPGVNVNAEIRSRVAEGAVTIPKEAVRRQSGVAGVFLLVGERLAWRVVELGVSNVTRTQVVKGLAAGDRVALPSEIVLVDGMQVTAWGQ